MKVLAVESSCDETAVAIVEDGTKILSNEVASQIDIHARYGGVVPEVASRVHLLSIVPTYRQALDKSGLTLDSVDAIAVTNGPGLAGSLLVGVNFAKALALGSGKPLIAVNHLEGHIYANWLYGHTPQFPCLCLIVSGGHSDLVLMRGHGDYSRLGGTRDDAAGEAFDKAARVLGLGYPGGPAIDKASRDGIANIVLPQAMLKGTYDFSFSGLKTALVRLAEAGKISSANNAAASFQEAVTEVLTAKTVEAAADLDAREILLAGGVAANRRLREKLQNRSTVPVSIPPIGLCTDNAAIIGSCACFRYLSGARDQLDIDVVPCLNLG